MRFKSKSSMSLGLMVTAAIVLISASKWPLKAALFPLIIGIAAFGMSTAEFLLSTFEKEKKEGAKKEAAIDFSFSEDIDKTVALRRTLIIFAWVFGFFLMVILLGFPITVPLFVFIYMKFQGREKWGISIILSAFACGSFYGLFVWLLDTPFEEGLVQKLLGIG